MTTLISRQEATAAAEGHVDAFRDWFANAIDTLGHLASFNLDAARAAVNRASARSLLPDTGDALPVAAEIAPLGEGLDYVWSMVRIGFHSQREFLRVADTHWAGLAEGYAVMFDRAALFPPASLSALTAAAALRAGFAAFTAAWRSAARTLRQIAAMNEANAADAAKVIDLGSARLLPSRKAA